MRGGLRIALCIALGPALLASGSRSAIASPDDGGGRDVSVALFSTLRLHAVTVTPLGPHAWTARCVQCEHRPLTAPLHLAGPMEIFAGGPLRIADDATGEARAATGLWHLRAIGRDGETYVVLTLPSERYVAAVLNGETAPGEPPQSLRALAVLARTYALNSGHFAAARGGLPAELCDSTECQAMNFGPVSQVVEDATRATAGETLWFDDHRAEVFFSQNCGGQTEDAGSVWPKLRGLPYLRSHADPYCVRRDTALWHAEVPLAQFAAIARVEGWHVPANIVAARVADRSQSHRALRIAFTGSDGVSSIISASALRFGVGRSLGWDRVRSDAYELAVRNQALVFDGRGHGHGVGFCQAGATEMAAEGKSARQILDFYFPGTAVRILRGDDGWQEMRSGPLTLRATHPFSAQQSAVMENTWTKAQTLFPASRVIAPEIFFAPSTEVFRQLTAQPGWMLASTRGSTIVLQPDAILGARGTTASATLLHEMLHVLVESGSTGRAPLWLREGLVEVLAGEPGEGPNTMSTGMIEDALLHADSLRVSERAHHAAAVRVRDLIARYGPSKVRGWLSSGVPDGVK